MPNCLECGQEITEIQYHNFKGICPNCVQLWKKRMNVDGNWGWLIFLAAIGLLVVLSIFSNWIADFIYPLAS